MKKALKTVGLFISSTLVWGFLTLFLVPHGLLFMVIYLFLFPTLA